MYKRQGGIYAIDIRQEDELIEAKVTNGENDIILGTSNGKSIRFKENDVRPTGRKTMGVRGISLGSKNDYVVGMMIVKREGTILVASDKGLGKRTNVIEYRTQNRGGKGIITLKTTSKVGKMVAMLEVVDNDDLMTRLDFLSLRTASLTLSIALSRSILMALATLATASRFLLSLCMYGFLQVRLLCSISASVSGCGGSGF